MTARLASSLLAGAIISVCLFWLMSAMVMGIRREAPKTGAVKMIEFVRLKRDDTPKTESRRKPPQPPPAQQPPPPPVLQTAKVQAPPKADMPRIDIPALAAAPKFDRFAVSALTGVKAGAEQGPAAGAGAEPVAAGADLIPLLRIAPKYPMRAQMRRQEGWVKVMFIITDTGTVRDVEIVEAHPEGVFDRAARDAIEKWKFKPKVVAGRAVEQRAVQVLEFRLSK